MSDNAPKPSPTHILEMGRLAELGLYSAELVHEIRQPLFAAKSLVQLAQAEVAKGQPKLDRLGDQLAVIADQVELMEALLSRYGGAGRPSTDAARPVLLAPPVTAAVQMPGIRARTAGITLDLELIDGHSAVMGEVVAIQQVVGNLVNNAVDAARQRVVVRVDGALVQVVDDGPEPDPDALSRAFELFFTTKPPGKGTGLGLAVCKGLAESFGATLHLERVGDTTVVSVRFRALDSALDSALEGEHG